MWEVTSKRFGHPAIICISLVDIDARSHPLRFAANAILLPSMHMLGNLRPEDASPLLKHVDSLEGKGDGPVDRNMWEHFRGAFGRTTGEQVSMYDWNTGKRGEAEVDDRQTACE